MQYRKLIILLVSALIIAGIMAGCAGGGGTNLEVALSHAKFISSGDELIGGPVAQGEEGDILIYNNFARFIVKATYSVTSFPLDGMVIDADIRRLPGEKGRDIVGGIVFSPYPDHIVKVSQIYDIYPAISIADDGSLSGVPQVRVTGVDAYFPYPVSFQSDSTVSPVTNALPLEYVINYYLPGDSPCLEILTEVKNTSDNDVTIHPALLQLPGPGKVFSGGYGFGDPSKINGALKGIVYLSKEFDDITFGLYLGNMLPEALALAGEVEGEDGYLKYAPENDTVVVPGGESIGLIYSYCVVKGYSADLYSAIVKKEKMDKTYVEGYTCFTSGNDREVNEDSTSRKVCTTEDESEELGRPANEMVDDIDIFVYDRDENIIAHTRSGDQSEVYYTAFKTLSSTGFYSRNDFKGKYTLYLPDTYYKIWGVKKGWDLPDVSFLVITPGTNAADVEEMDVEHVDFLFSRPITVDVFTKIIPATPTPARLIVKGDDLYPVSITPLAGKFGFDYDNPFTTPAEVFFVPSSGHLVLHLRKGKYSLIADKSFLYNRVEKEIELKSKTTLLFKFIKLLDTGGYVAVDPFVENFSFGIGFDEETRDISVESADLKGSLLVDLNAYPVTDVSSLEAVYGSYFETDFGNFMLFPLTSDYRLPENAFDSISSFLKRRSYYTVVADPSSDDSYFYSLGVSEELSTGRFLPSDYSNNYDFLQILPAGDLNYTLVHWFRMLQMAPEGKDENFIFHPVIGGSYSGDPVLSPPGYTMTFLYKNELTGETPSPQRCVDLTAMDEDLSQALCNLVKGASAVGRYVYFSLTVTTDRGQRAQPGEILSIIAGEKVYLNLTIQSPVWAKFDTVYVFDGRQSYKPGENPFDKAYKLNVTPTQYQVGYESGMVRYQWSGVIQYPFSLDQNADSWLVVVVTGSDPADNYPALKPIAISNPVFIDSDVARGYNPPCPGQFCPGR